MKNCNEVVDIEACLEIRNKALDFTRSGNYRRALDKFLELIERNPNSFSEHYLDLMAVAGYMRQIELGNRFVQKALLEFPVEKRYLVHYGKGHFYYTMSCNVGEMSPAQTQEFQQITINAFRESIGLNANYYKSHTYLAHTYYCTRQYDEMRTSFDNAKGCADIKILYHIYYEEACALMKVANSFRLAGNDQEKTRYLDLSRQSIARSREIKPDYYLVELLSFQICMLFENDLIAANTHYQRALQLCAGNSVLRASIHYLCAAFCDNDRAISLYERCLNENPNHSYAYYHLAKRYKERNDFLKARAYVYEFMKRVSNHQGATELLEQINQSLNDGDHNPTGESIASTIMLNPIELPQDLVTLSDPPEQLGEGGFGEVFAGTYRNAQIAIKTFVNGQPAAIVAELINATYLRNPSIIQCYGFCSSVTINYGLNRPALITERAERSLAHILQEQNIDLHADLQFEIAAGVAFGLNYMHSKDVLHGDLKSLNVLMNGFTPKICDFGTSKFRPHSEQTFVGIGEAAVTLRWAPPEIFRMERSGKDSDIYSFGVILWELGARQLPLRQLNNQQIVMTMIEQGHDNRQSIEPISPMTLLSMANLIRRCWETRRENRPDASEAVRVLRDNVTYNL